MGRRSAGLFAAVFLFAACAGGSRPPAAELSPPPTPQSGLDEVLVRFGEHTLRAEVADEPLEQQTGLMHRDSLDADAGMLFVFPAPVRTGFWMKDTSIPLSIAYMREVGPQAFEVLEIADMEPCRADPCPTYDPGQGYDAALEANRGWFAGAGVAPGDRAIVEPL